MKTTYYKGIAIKKVGTYNCKYQVALCGLLRTFFNKASAKEYINEYLKGE